MLNLIKKDKLNKNAIYNNENVKYAENTKFNKKVKRRICI